MSTPLADSDNKCEIHGCKRKALVKRLICEYHAFPQERKPGETGRRAAIKATKEKRTTKVSKEITDK